MKSLISGTLILLALYAQAACAQDSQARLLILNSQILSYSEQVTSIQPTLFIPMNQPQYGLIAFTRINRHQSSHLQEIKQSHISDVYGVGMHHRVNAWMFTQVVVQSQQFGALEGGYESMLSLTAKF